MLNVTRLSFLWPFLKQMIYRYTMNVY